ncbi:alpha/beta-hydrolase [Lactarius deliciosus]|nr:alpha/beta-hydrolase [Lactarius deliciosus]
MSPRRAPFGTWSSPITADVLVQSIYHVEGRPSEGGRAVIVDTIANKDIFSSEWNATTKVHEYGGGAAIVYDGTTYFSHSPDGRVYSLKDGSEPKAVTPAEVPFRYADFDLHPINRHFLAAVFEDHTNDDPTTVVNTLVVINTKNQSLTTIASGADFYAAPRFSPDGARIAFRQWNHPDMPWQRSAIHVFTFVADGDMITYGNEKEIAWGQREVSVGYPGWIDSDTLVFLTDESGFLNPWAYSVSSKSADPLLATPISQDFAVPAFDLAGSPYTVLDMEKRVVLFSALKNGRNVLYLFYWKTKSLIPVDNPFVSINAIRAVDDKTLVFIARSTRTPSAIIKLTISDPSAPHPGVTYQTLKSSAGSLPFPDSIISHPESLTLGTASEPVSDPTEKPPCIVNAHGGPTGMTAQGLDWTTQYFTSRGWAWVDVDYSGSGGYGRKYIDRLNGAWGVADVADCASAATALALAPQGRTDGARTANRDGSAGGFTTLAAVSQPATRHTFTMCMWGAAPSIMRKIYAPALGTEDKVVPPEQADAIEKIMQAQGRHVEKVLFGGEGYGFIKAESIKVALETERGFYEKMFGIGSQPRCKEGSGSYRTDGRPRPSERHNAYIRRPGRLN